MARIPTFDNDDSASDQELPEDIVLEGEDIGEESSGIDLDFRAKPPRSG